MINNIIANVEFETNYKYIKKYEYYNNAVHIVNKEIDNEIDKEIDNEIDKNINELIIIFEGSNDIFDMITNLELYFVKCDFNEDINVNYRLKYAFDNMINDILQIIVPFINKTKITIFGDSLGGAFAQYLFMYFLYKIKSKDDNQLYLTLNYNDFINSYDILSLDCITYNTAPFFSSNNKKYESFNNKIKEIKNKNNNINFINILNCGNSVNESLYDDNYDGISLFTEMFMTRAQLTNENGKIYRLYKEKDTIKEIYPYTSDYKQTFIGTLRVRIYVIYSLIFKFDKYKKNHLLKNVH